MQRDQEYQHLQLVAVIRKSDKLEIRVSISKYRGRRFGDLRLFVPDEQGAWIPTRKGITVPFERLEELEKAVMKLRGAAEESVLLSQIREWRPPV